ncbi:amino acid adenylation domain-containing protein [Sorangium sp. So ce281]|uniref:amino acid adenylation domain-containing protein n=1 Tax=unclassified Sorangium TaxID=2621164 RepID=UPI003F5FBDA2
MTDLPLHTFLADLAAQGIRLSIHDDRLRCDAPRDRLSPALREALAARKHEIVQHLSRSASARIERAPEGPVPLSPAQQRLWVLARMDEASAAYNMRTALRITGPLDPAAIEAALAGVVRRHAVLRTAFSTIASEPVQVVHEGVALAVDRIDLCGAADGDAALERVLAASATTPFDLGRPPLVRAAIVRTAPLQHVLVLTLHHLVADGASLGILAAEIAELYTAAVRGRPHRLPALPVQYADFAVWQRRRLDPERLAQLRAYWLGQLAGAPPRLELPTDHPRKQDGASRQGAIARFILPQALAEAVRRTSQTSGATVFATLLTGFVLLMARYTNQDDIVIGAPASLRDHPDLEPLIGMFVNTVVLRVRLDGDPTLEALRGRVRQTVAEAYAHADFPLDRLVDALQPERSPTHHPVFQVMFIHDNAPTAVGGVADLDLEILEHRTFDAKFDLMLAMSEGADGIRGVWEYRRDLFEPATIARATQHFLRLLEALALTPRTRALEAPLLSGAERHQVLRAWNRTEQVYPDDLPVHRLFERQAGRTPHALAVREVAGPGQWTYAELDRRASRIASHLAAQGVGRGDRVAVLLPRSPDLLATLLGVWKAGAAYIPLDPSYPAARLDFMLGDAAPACLVTTDALAARLGQTPARAIRLDRDPISDDVAAPEVEAAPADPAYLMYTSGSTGRPKAAIISHAALANYLRWCVTAYAVDRGAGSAVSTSIAFDATVTSLYTPLLVGRPVLLLPEGDEIHHLAALMSGDRPLAPIKLTPAHIDALRAVSGEQVRPGGAHVVVVGGEQLLGEHVTWCRTMAPQARIFNEYGPTETTVGCCVYEVPHGQPPDIVPIGKPIANTRLYVLNERLEPAPIGVIGELYIAGHGVARGYLNRPELVAERFVPDPFSPDPEARMYRTGDLAFWALDGDLRFIGRRDGQVKLRGYRIELTEIEAALLQHPSVRQAAVVVRAGAGQRPHLVAFLVAAERRTPDANALRDHLAHHLPEPMVPAVLHWMAALPLTPNGKVDRAALSVAPIEAAAEPPPAATAEHQALIELWCGVLGRDQVGVTDNFFALGGDSILGIQLVARARERGIHFTPRDLVENQTVAELARVVRSAPQAPVSAGPGAGPVVTTPIQRWFFAQALPEPHHYNQSLLLEVPGDIDADALHAALRALVEHHDALRMRFAPSGEATLAREANVKLEVVDLSDLPAERRRSALEAEADARQRMLDLAGPLFAPALFRLGESARLLLTTHHLIVDGVSWRILLEDLARSYEQATARRPIALPPRTSSVQAWGRRLREWAGSAALAAERATWSQVPALPEKRLPVDDAGPAEANLAGLTAVVTRTLTAGETERLRATRALADADVQEVLIAALARAFAEGDDATTLAVDLESHGRADLFDDLDVSRTVGWFTAVYPVHLELRGAASPAETLSAVRAQLRAVPNLGLGYGVLRSFGDLPGARPAPIRFNYFGQLDRAQPTTSGWRLADESCGAQRSPSGARVHLIEIDASILDGRLTIEWRYAGRSFSRATMESLAASFVSALLGLVRHCHEASVPAPSDAAHPAAQRWSPLVPVGRHARGPASSGERPLVPLFCVPGAAMDVISLHPLSQALGPDQPLYGLQPRGLDGALEPHRTVEEIAACNVAALRAVQPHGPYRVAGHSFGAYVAYEMAQQLREAGDSVAMLAIFDAEACDHRSAAAAVARTRTDRLHRLLSLVQRFVGRALPLRVDSLARLAPEELVQQVAAALVEAGILPVEVSSEQVERYLRVGEASALAFDAYRPAGRHPVRTLLFRARDRHADDDALGAGRASDETLGWRALVQDATTHWVPGDHVTLLTLPHVHEVAAVLRRTIQDRTVAA